MKIDLTPCTVQFALNYFQDSHLVARVTHSNYIVSITFLFCVPKNSLDVHINCASKIILPAEHETLNYPAFTMITTKGNS